MFLQVFGFFAFIVFGIIIFISFIMFLIWASKAAVFRDTLKNIIGEDEYIKIEEESLANGKLLFLQIPLNLIKLGDDTHKKIKTSLEYKSYFFYFKFYLGFFIVLFFVIIIGDIISSISN